MTRRLLFVHVARRLKIFDRPFLRSMENTPRGVVSNPKLPLVNLRDWIDTVRYKNIFCILRV